VSLPGAWSSFSCPEIDWTFVLSTATLNFTGGHAASHLLKQFIAPSSTNTCCGIAAARLVEEIPFAVNTQPKGIASQQSAGK